MNDKHKAPLAAARLLVSAGMETDLRLPAHT